jgi:hypothetical protein
MSSYYLLVVPNMLSKLAIHQHLHASTDADARGAKYLPFVAYPTELDFLIAVEGTLAQTEGPTLCPDSNRE